jgi:hypothetical protein
VSPTGLVIQRVGAAATTEPAATGG